MESMINVYICENLAYKIIHYTNLDAIKADEFRNNLGVKVDQSIWIERKMIAIVIKIFAKESMLSVKFLDYLIKLICVLLLIN